MLMSVLPNFQLLLSMARQNGPFMGNRRKMTRAMRSRSRSNLAKKRWILRKHDDDFAGESKTVDKRLKHTAFALHRATTNSDMSLIWARLMFFPKKVTNVSDNSLFLLP